MLIPAHGVLTSSVKNGVAPIFISIGQSTCYSSNEFLHQDIIGKVIATGDYPKNLDKINPALDYAIVRISQIVDIKPALIPTEYMSPANSLMVVGFPLTYTFNTKTGFRYPTASFVKLMNIGSDGSFTTSNTKNDFGSSGSGVFVLDEDKERPELIVAGMIRGRSGWGIQTAAILIRLKKDSPEIFKELGDAIQTNSCNNIK